MDEPKFVTFTQVHSDEPLKDQIQSLMASFRRLRQRTAWKKHVRGGIVVIEVTYNAEKDEWHPHLHLIADAKFWPVEELRESWREVTKGSFIVDIQRPKSQSHIVSYVAKYVSKTNTPTGCPPHRMAEWVHATKGLRMVGTYGTHHGTWKREPPKPAPASDRLAPVRACERVCTRDATAAVILEKVLHPLPKPKKEDPAQEFVRWEEKNHQLAKLIRAWYALYLHKPPPPTAAYHRSASRARTTRGGFWPEE